MKLPIGWEIYYQGLVKLFMWRTIALFLYDYYIIFTISCQVD
nr:MAG TPA: hypothetical protein [Caudoviricetes sp.]